MTWVAVLPVVAVVSKLMLGPALLSWITTAIVMVTGVFFARGRGVPLAPAENRLAARAVLTGATTGDPSLDGYALGILDARRRIGQTVENITLSVVIVALVAAPILASITLGIWWLLMVPLDAALLVGAAPYRALDIVGNIRRLEAATPRETDLP